MEQEKTANDLLKEYEMSFMTGMEPDKVNEVTSKIREIESKPAEIPAVSTVQFQPEDPKPTLESDTEEIFDGIKDTKQNIEERSARLQKLQEQYEINQKSDVNEMVTDDSLESVLGAIMNEPTDKPPVYDDSPSMEEVLRMYEEKKVYTDEYEHNEYLSGPSNYIIEDDLQYISNVDDILKSNNIHIVPATKGDKKALINRYVNTGVSVTLTLPNTGIYVTISGAGIDELVAMANLPETTRISEKNRELGRGASLVELAKMKFIFDHIKDSTIGRFQTLQQMLNVISYYDIPTLYYGLFAATHPKVVDIERTCKKCRKPYNIKMNTNDMLINYKDFERTDVDIKNNVTYAQFLKSDKMSTMLRHVTKSGIVIYYKHPSIASFIKTLADIDDDVIERYPEISNFSYSIPKIAMPTDSTLQSFIEFDDPNDIVEIIAKSKDCGLKYEISDLIDKARNEVIPQYGFKSAKCPHCKAVDAESVVSIDDLLFIVARTEAMEATLNRAVKLEKAEKSKRESKE